ncbi:MAG TPA: heme exporter protein CcmB [Candidatus Limnocylindria bacterium]|nr:heme exporter protein CcmB [Candidatus Limnocylindria bacterium]
MTLRHIRIIAAREALAERGQPDGLVSAVTFIATLILVESLAVGPLAASQPAVAAALFWIAMAFAAIIVTSRSFERELEDDALGAVLALPGGRDAIYGGKVVALAALLALVAAVGGGLSLVLLSLDVALPGHLLTVAAAGVLSLPPVMVLFVALALRLRSRGTLVPILVLPVLVPQLVAATNGTAAAMSGDTAGALGWAGLLVAFALVYSVLGLTIVPAALE